jgi:hypothetical protein
MILINVREYRRVIKNGQDVNQTYKQNTTCECHRQSKFGKNITTNRKLSISILSYDNVSPAHFFIFREENKFQNKLFIKLML